MYNAKLHQHFHCLAASKNRASIESMPMPFETEFNNAGTKPRSLKAMFLSQRKWILLCAGTIFLLSNDYVAFNQKWLFAEFKIGYWSTSLLRAIGISGLFFTTYMWLSAYAFLKKHKADNRRLFDELEIEERDTSTNRITELNSEKERLELEITARQQQKSKSEIQIKADASAITKLRDLKKNIYLGERITVSPELRQHVLNAEKEPVSVLIFSDAWSDEEVSEAISILSEREKRNTREIRDAEKTIRALLEQSTGVQNAIVEETKKQTTILTLNEQEWKKFYRRRTAADFVSLVPSILGSVYCGLHVFLSFAE